jgi:hypothetical protein
MARKKEDEKTKVEKKLLQRGNGGGKGAVNAVKGFYYEEDFQ